MSDAARYAATLLRQATAAFAVAPEARKKASLPVLDAFLAEPGPLTFLAASRVLTVMKRDARATQLLHRVAGRVFERGKLAVARIDGVDAALMETFNALELSLIHI